MVKLGWVTEEHVNRVIWMFMPFTTFAVFYGLFIFDPRSKEEIAVIRKLQQQKEERRARSQYREDL